MAGDGDDHRQGREGAKPAPEARDAGAHQLWLRLGRLAPGVLLQALDADHLAGVGHQMLEQPVLVQRQRRRGAAQPGRAFGRHELEHRRVGPLAVHQPRQRLQPRLYLDELQRTRETGVGARLEQIRVLALVARRGDHQQQGVRRSRRKASGPVVGRRRPVQNHAAVVAGPGHGQAVGRIGRLLDHVADLAQRPDEVGVKRSVGGVEQVHGGQ